MQRLLWLALLASSCLACTPPSDVGGSASTPEEAVGSSLTVVDEQERYRVEEVVTGVEVPWSIVWDHTGRMIFTERPGRVRVYENGKLRAKPLFDVPDVTARSESGLMGLTLHPEFAKSRYLYLAYAYRGQGEQKVKVVRYVEDGETLEQDKIIIQGIPAAPNHAGCKIAFGPDGKLYITAGDSTDWTLAQQLDSLAGKILRVNDDGSIPNDNPFVDRADARPEIWAYGSRNAQGMDWHPKTGMMVITEHGPSGFEGLGGGGDEVNVVEKGDNLGWPTIHHKQTRAGMVSPVLEYTPAVAPASGIFYDGKAFPQWQNNYFFGNLVGRSVIRVKFEGRKVAETEKMLTSYGRIRAVAEGPDGYFYFSTSNRDGRGRPAENDDRILRLVPK